MSHNTKLGTVGDVRRMYEAYPYPSPIVGGTLIEDVANSLCTIFGENKLSGQRVLDAGCGTGQRLLAVAQRYPEAQFVGLDMTAASIEVARALSQRHGIRNVEFHRSELLAFHPESPFDLILSIGVVHHLETPSLGVQFLAFHLRESGILILWLYHALGEHQRLLDRETLMALWDRAEGFEAGLQVLHDMGLKLEMKRYGSSAAQSKSETSQLSIDVDAYLHPVVNAYRFNEMIAMMRDYAHLDWAAINNINFQNASKLIDLYEIETGDVRYFCQTPEDVFEAESLRKRFRRLDPFKKLQVIECRLKPTGFTIIGGRGDPSEILTQRVRSNVISL